MGYENGFRPATNGVHQKIDGPERLTVGANATAAKMIPGIVVMKDTAGTVKEYTGTGAFIGALGYEYVQPGDYKPDTRDDHFNVGDRVPVHVKPGDRVYCRAAASQTIVKGQKLTVTTDGLLAIPTLTVAVPDGGGNVAIPLIACTADEPLTTGAGDAGDGIWVIWG